VSKVWLGLNSVVGNHNVKKASVLQKVSLDVFHESAVCILFASHVKANSTQFSDNQIFRQSVTDRRFPLLILLFHNPKTIDQLPLQTPKLALASIHHKVSLPQFSPSLAPTTKCASLQTLSVFSSAKSLHPALTKH
jgi:hypothetical protein